MELTVPPLQQTFPAALRRRMLTACPSQALRPPPDGCDVPVPAWPGEGNPAGLKRESESSHVTAGPRMCRATSRGSQILGDSEEVGLWPDVSSLTSHLSHANLVRSLIPPEPHSNPAKQVVYSQFIHAETEVQNGKITYPESHSIPVWVP